PAARPNAAIFAMLRSKASSSMSSAGVSTSATGTPISAGGGFIRLRSVLWTLPYAMADWLVFGGGATRRHSPAQPEPRLCSGIAAAIAPALAHHIYKGMSEQKVTLRWERGGAEFSYQKYPRDHTWSFDGGHTMTATAAPAYLGNPANVDPEEAFVASLSSCHM